MNFLRCTKFCLAGFLLSALLAQNVVIAQWIETQPRRVAKLTRNEKTLSEKNIKSQMPVISPVMASAQSICNGLATSSTAPTQFTPPPATNQNGVPEIVSFPAGTTFPIPTNGTVKYLTGFQKITEAQSVSALTGFDTEWYDGCNAMNQQPSWDPTVYPGPSGYGGNTPDSVWDYNSLRTCLFDPTPLSDPTAIARVWNLETGQCEEVSPINHSACYSDYSWMLPAIINHPSATHMLWYESSQGLYCGGYYGVGPNFLECQTAFSAVDFLPSNFGTVSSCLACFNSGANHLYDYSNGVCH